jgi:hypothetical protein
MEVHIQQVRGGYILVVERQTEGGLTGEVFVFTSPEEVMDYAMSQFRTSDDRGGGGKPVPVPS